LEQLSDLGERPLVVSPHLDDAVWSTGALLYELVAGGQKPLVATVFTDSPPADLGLTTFAQEMHDKWGGSADEVWRQRQSEDRIALDHLQVESRNLGFLDAIYRDYVDENLLAGELLERDSELGARIVEQLEPLLTTDAAVVLPLAVGGHVDHLVCFELHSILEPMVARVLFYEDFPYMSRPGDETRRHEELATQGLHPVSYQLTIGDDALGVHQDATALYVSQVDGFFPTRSDLDRDVAWLLHTRFEDAPSPQITLWSL